MKSETLLIGSNDDVLIEILAKLPPESVFRFKSVSRRWRDLLSSPRFAQRHATAHRHGSGRLMAFFQKAAVHETSETLTAKHCNTLRICKDREENIVVIPKHVGHFINSSNSLILCSRTHGSVITYQVANPLTGKVVELPPPPHAERCLVLNEFYPFGKYGRLNSESDRMQLPLLSAVLICEENKKLDLQAPNYSVVRLGMKYFRRDKILYIDSYSSKTGKWSAMREVVATGILYLSEKPPAVANGVIHWYTGEGNIAVYDPNDEHVQFIGVPLAGKNESYAVTRTADDDDVLWLGLVRRHNMLFYKLPKTNGNGNGGSYKRQVDIDAKEWELVHDVSIEALCKKWSNKKLRKRAAAGMVGCKKTILECLIQESRSEVVALLRQDDKLFLYNVHTNSVQKVDYSGRYNQNHALSPYFISSSSSSLPSYYL